MFQTNRQNPWNGRIVDSEGSYNRPELWIFSFVKSFRKIVEQLTTES